MADHEAEIELLDRYLKECHLELRVKEVAAVLNANRGALENVEDVDM